MTLEGLLLLLLPTSLPFFSSAEFCTLRHSEVTRLAGPKTQYCKSLRASKCVQDSYAYMQLQSGKKEIREDLNLIEKPRLRVKLKQQRLFEK